MLPPQPQLQIPQPPMLGNSMTLLPHRPTLSPFQIIQLRFLINLNPLFHLLPAHPAIPTHLNQSSSFTFLRAHTYSQIQTSSVGSAAHITRLSSCCSSKPGTFVTTPHITLRVNHKWHQSWPKCILITELCNTSTSHTITIHRFVVGPPQEFGLWR